MVRTGETIDAAMLAPPVGIDAGIEANVGAVVVIDDGARFVFQENGVGGRVLRLVPFACLIGRFFESIRRITRGPAPSPLFSAHGSYYNSRRMNPSEHLAELGHDFHRRGWVLGTSGNFSTVIEREPLRIAITASSLDKSRLL